MQPVVLFEDVGAWNLTPLVYWRTVFELRCGRKTLHDRVAHSLGAPIAGLWTREAWAGLAEERFQVPVNEPPTPGTLLINSRWLIDRPLEFRPPPFAATCGDQVVYVACDAALAKRLRPADLLDADRAAELVRSVEHGPVEARMIRHVWDLVSQNAWALEADWSGDRAIEGKVSSSALLLDPDSIHIGARAVVAPSAVLDAESGPIYVAEGARISPQAYVAGPAYIGPGAAVNPHACVCGGTAIGPMCKVGGEVEACIIAGYSNTQHAGFLGHSYVGSWVNIGAGTVNSNLKNTYGSVRVPINGMEIDTGLTLFGAVIGDHAKLAIGQTLPTGASVGFAAMTACSGVLPKFVPSFTWLTDDQATQGDPPRLLTAARRMMKRRGINLTDTEVKLFQHVAQTARDQESPGSA